jgi:topoisomerase-4 subunit A
VRLVFEPKTSRIVTKLPPGTSTAKVLEEIEELTNPKVKVGKKAPSAGSTLH